MKTQAAPVVAEPLPREDHVGGRRCRKRLDGRPPLEPGEIAGNDALDLGLLQHHLRDEDRVRVACPSPREIATMNVEPGDQ
jgi:hypothetical protein